MVAKITSQLYRQHKYRMCPTIPLVILLLELINTVLLIQLKLTIKVWSGGEDKFLEQMIHQAQLPNSSRIEQTLDLDWTIRFLLSLIWIRDTIMHMDYHY